jgi:hypothetical protein
MREIDSFLEPKIAEITPKPQQSDNLKKINNLYIEIPSIADKLLKGNVLRDVWGKGAEIVARAACPDSSGSRP